MTTQAATQLADKLNSKVWTSGEHVRIYIDPLAAMKMAGYYIETFNGSKRISSCRFGGSKVSNNIATMIFSSLRDGIWYDVNADEVMLKYPGDRKVRSEVADVRYFVEEKIKEIAAAL